MTCGSGSLNSSGIFWMIELHASLSFSYSFVSTAIFCSLSFRLFSFTARLFSSFVTSPLHLSLSFFAMLIRSSRSSWNSGTWVTYGCSTEPHSGHGSPSLSFFLWSSRLAVRSLILASLSRISSECNALSRSFLASVSRPGSNPVSCCIFIIVSLSSEREEAFSSKTAFSVL